MSARRWWSKAARVRPAGLMSLGLLVGYLGVFGPQLPQPGHRAGPGFVAYRGPHRIGDMIGPNARVVSVDRHADPTAVVSTDGRPPIVWAFELADPATLTPIRGRRTHFGPDLWHHAACPGPICTGGRSSTATPPQPSPPPPMNVDICPALSPADLIARLGAGRGSYSASSPIPGVCVWDNGVAGVEVEVGGPEWWSYLTGLKGLYRADPGSPDVLVADRGGLHIAVRTTRVTAVLLTYTNTSASNWTPVASEVARWVSTQ